MSNVNKVILLGRLGKDPETRYTQNGDAVANFSVATSFGSGDQQKTEWHRCTAWKKQAELIDQFVKKGHLIYIEGRLETRKWTDKEGNDKYTTEVVVERVQLIGETVRRERQDDDDRPAPRQQTQRPAQTQGNIAEMDDDIPF